MTSEPLRDVLAFFPKDEPYPNQEIALRRVIKAFDVGGAKNVILEAPVGFGKSPVAICLANYYGGGHILTPRKALQDQYTQDFPKETTPLKGMSNYPCFPCATNPKSQKVIQTSDISYSDAISEVIRGNTPRFKGLSCASAPCRGDKETFMECTGVQECTYRLAIDLACKAKITVSNLHSFIANTLFIERLLEKPILIIDEAHDMEDILRGYLTLTFKVPYPVVSARMNIPEYEEMEDWIDWFKQETFTKHLSKDSLDEYLEAVNSFDKYGMKNFVTSYEEKFGEYTNFTFEPRNLGNAAENFLLKYGTRRLLMSGTIYDKDHFCKINGIDAEDTVFIRMGSTFPPANCPIILRHQTLSNNSHKTFEQNYERNLDAIRRALKIYHNVRGLIHAPSYDIAHRLQRSLLDERLITHTSENFADVLRYFLEESPDNAVLISPTCQQGIDLKYDRARFQIILRVPYPSISSSLMKDLVDNNPAAYTYKALVTFGQMLGRPMRAPDDWGHTILLDYRFLEFINRGRKLLGDDVMKRIKKV